MELFFVPCKPSINATKPVLNMGRPVVNYNHIHINSLVIQIYLRMLEAEKHIVRQFVVINCVGTV